MMIENMNIQNRSLEDDIAFKRALLDKHSQLMRMYIRHNNMKLAKEQFDTLKPIFNSLNDKGETMNYYTLEDFEGDLKRFKSR